MPKCDYTPVTTRTRRQRQDWQAPAWSVPFRTTYELHIFLRLHVGPGTSLHCEQAVGSKFNPQNTCKAARPGVTHLKSQFSVGQEDTFRTRGTIQNPVYSVSPKPMRDSKEKDKPPEADTSGLDSNMHIHAHTCTHNLAHTTGQLGC